jgi:hypothetical protein
MKYEVEITNVWATFDIDEEVIIAFNKKNDVPDHLQKSFRVAYALGFNAFEYTGGDWSFSSETITNAHNNQTGKTWSKFDTADNTIID